MTPGPDIRACVNPSSRFGRSHTGIYGLVPTASVPTSRVPTYRVIEGRIVGGEELDYPRQFQFLVSLPSEWGGSHEV